MQTNQIIHGDAVSVLSRMESGSVDLVVTDPPYLVRYKDRTGRMIANDDNPDAVLPVFPELYRVLRPNSYALVFCGWSAIAQFANAWDQAGFRTVGHIVWRKNYSSSLCYFAYHHESAWLLAKGQPAAPAYPLADVQDWVYSGNKLHPTEKAVEIIRPLTERFSHPGNIVLDPFLGSGTTAIAAAMTGRFCIGVELEERYCALARRRLEGLEQHRLAA